MTPTWALLETLIEFLTEDQYLTNLPLVDAFFAGGAVRDISNGRWPKDYDIFFGSQADVDKAIVILDQLALADSVLGMIGTEAFKVEKTRFGNYNLTFTSLPGFQGQVTVQFITMISGSVGEVTSKFDFTCNQCWYRIADSVRYVSPGAAKGSMLSMCSNIHRPVQALFRIQKFVAMGYLIPGETLVALVNKITTEGIPVDRIVSELGFCVSGEENTATPIGTITTGDLNAEVFRRVATPMAEVILTPRVIPFTQTTPEIVSTTFNAPRTEVIYMQQGPIGIGSHEARRFTPEEIGLARNLLEQPITVTLPSMGIPFPDLLPNPN